MGAMVKGVTDRRQRSYLDSLALAALLVVGALLIFSCQASTQIIEDITVQEAFDLIEEEQGNPDFTIIDVRTPGEYAEGHLENAVNINFNAADFEDRVDELDKDKTYVIYCRTGVRSAGARDVMKKLGFSEVYNVLDGITGWTAAGFPVVK